MPYLGKFKIIEITKLAAKDRFLTRSAALYLYIIFQSHDKPTIKPCSQQANWTQLNWTDLHQVDPITRRAIGHVRQCHEADWLHGCTAAGLQCKYFVSVRRTTNRSLGGRTRQVQVVGLDVWIKHQTSQFSACSPGCATAASERFSVPRPKQLHIRPWLGFDLQLTKGVTVCAYTGVAD